MFRSRKTLTPCVLAAAGAAALGAVAPALADLTWNSNYNLTTSGASAANGTSLFQNANWTDSTTGLAYTGTLATGTQVNQPMFVNDGYLTSFTASNPLRLGSTGSLTVTGGFIRFVSANLSTVANDITNNANADATGQPPVSISGGRVWVSAVRDVAVTLSGNGSLRLGGNSSTANATGANGDPISHSATVNITSENARLEFGRKDTNAVVNDHVNTGEIVIDGATPVLGADPAFWEIGDTAVITTVAVNQYATFTTVRKQVAEYGSCAASGGCTITYQANCSGVWTVNGSCAGSCTVSGICTPVTTSADCTGAYVMGGACAPALFQPADAGFEGADVSTTYGNGTNGFAGTANSLNTQVSTWSDGDDFQSQVVVADGTTIPGTPGNKWGRLSLPNSSIHLGGLWTRIGNYDPSAGSWTIALDVGDRLNTTFNRINIALYVGNFPPDDNLVPGELGGTPVGGNPGVNTLAADIWGSETATAKTASILVTIPNAPGTGLVPQSGDAMWVLLYDNNSGAVALVDNIAVAGSCCAVDGTCTMARQENCTGPSAWTIGGTCSPNNCPIPSGECCVSNTCSVTNATDCANMAGIWAIGGTCSPNPCNAPTGSCCIAGACAISLQANCSGTWTQDGSCSPNPCPAQCCATDGSCSIVVEGACNGTWTSSGAACDPNPCPQPAGACCNNTTGECAVIFAGSCPGGTTSTGGTACDANSCPVVRVCCNTNTGECTLMYGGTSCAPGASQGSGLVCDPSTCPVLRVCCNNTTGACTPMYGGTDCTSGNTQGSGLVCEANTCDIVFGACCTPTTGVCSLMASTTCIGGGGVFLGLGTACPGGACYGEVEPNSRTFADYVNNPATLNSGDVIAGITTGGNFDPSGSPGTNAAVDLWLITTSAQPLGIYRHEMVQTQGTAGWGIRGRGQDTGAISGGNNGVQGSSGSTDMWRTAWYGFGKQEQVILEPFSGSSTPYVYRLTDTPVTPTVLAGTVAPGAVTIRVLDGGTTGNVIDSDCWLYDANFNALVNDPVDGPGGADGLIPAFDPADPAGTASRFTRTLAPGTYYLALSPVNLANNQPNDPSEGIVASTSNPRFTLYFPDVVLCSVMNGTSSYSATVQITDTSSNTISSPELSWSATWRGDVQFVQFTVGGSANGACCRGSTCQTDTSANCTGANTRYAGDGTACNTFGVNNSAPCCLADYNQSGGVSVQDIFDFLAAYFTANPSADINASGTVSVQDIFDFLGAYFAGC